MYQSLGEYEKAKTYQENALVITKEIGNRRGEAGLGTVYESLGEFEKAKTYQENALVIRKEIGDKQGEATCYGNLGAVYHSLGEYEKAVTLMLRVSSCRLLWWPRPAHTGLVSLLE